MFKKISKLVIVFIISLSLASCFREPMQEFFEGTYQYEGEEINFYNDFVVKNVAFNFTYIEKTEDRETFEQNCVINRMTQEKYNIDIIVTDGLDKMHNLNFVYSNGFANMQDMYKIIIDISELTNVDNSYILISLDFSNRESRNIASFYIQIYDFYIGEEKITDYNYPKRICLTNYLDE